MPNEQLRDLLRLFRRHDEIEIAHDFLSPPITSGDADMKRVGMRAQIVLQRFRFGRDLTELKRTGVFRRVRDRLAKFLLRRFSETGQFRDLSGFAGCLQLRDRADLAASRRAP